MAQGFQSQSQARLLQRKRPDVYAAWLKGRTLRGRSFRPSNLAALPIHKDRPHRRRRY